MNRGIEPDQWEMYNLDHDPEERVNLDDPGASLTTEQSAASERLTAKLREAVATRLQPL